MPSLITHAVVAVGAVRANRGSRATGAVYAAAAALACLPDADVVGFALRVPYDHPYGHRGMTHSLAFAALASLAVALPLARRQRLAAVSERSFPLWLLLFAVAASHGLLDAFTSGGRGIAFGWPFSNERFFAPWRPILVSPIGLDRFLSVRGVRVLVSEACCVWLPLAVWVGAAECARVVRIHAARRADAARPSLDCSAEEGLLDDRASEAQ